MPNSPEVKLHPYLLFVRMLATPTLVRDISLHIDTAGPNPPPRNLTCRAPIPFPEHLPLVGCPLITAVQFVVPRMTAPAIGGKPCI